MQQQRDAPGGHILQAGTASAAAKLHLQCACNRAVAGGLAVCSPQSPCLSPLPPINLSPHSSKLLGAATLLTAGWPQTLPLPPPPLTLLVGRSQL